MNHYALTLTTAGLMIAGLSAQAGLVAQESFESTPGTGYTLSAEFDDGFFDFFGQYAVPDAVNGARDDFTTGFDGGFAIFGQDQDGDGEAATQTITIDAVDISGLSDLGVTIAVGALNSEPNFNNYEASAGDGIKIFADIDGGGPTLIGEFAPNATGASDLYLDTNSDGIGDGPNLTTDLTDFTFLVGTGNSLVVTIEFTSTDSFEPLVVDNVRVFDAVPEPTSLALLGLGGLLVARRRRG